MAVAHQHPVDVVRKTAIVLVLIAGVLLVHQFAVPSADFDPRGLLALGFVVLAAHTVGDLVGVLRLPNITGYLLAGVVFGPSIAGLAAQVAPAAWLLPPLDEGIVSRRVIAQLGPIDALALAMIALTAGGELKTAELRKSLLHVTAMVGGMLTCVIASVCVFLLGLSQVAPDALPALRGLDPWSTTWVALAMAVLAAATSPAVAIAVVNSTGSRGPVTTTVLTGVVAGEVAVVLLFSAVSSVVLSALGVAGDVSVLDTLVGVAVSVGVGVSMGAIIAMYLRYVAVDVPLFLVAAIFATTFVLQRVHGEAALTFIAAGFVVGNLTAQGEALIHEVERLSKPVYVVFFALAGAKLHLDILWALLLPALGVFAIRAVGVYLGSTWGARVAGAPETVQRFGWMGLVSQAGMAIALANQARALLPAPVGDGVFSMAIAVISLNELVGPTVLQAGLSRAGEIPGDVPTVEAEALTGPVAPELAAWPVPEPTGSAALDEALLGLDRQLREAVASSLHPLLSEFRRHTEGGVRLLRREVLRTLRDVGSRAPAEAQPGLFVRSELGVLSDRWRDLVRELASTPPTWDPAVVVEALDRVVGQLPEAVWAPLGPRVLADRKEPPWARARRWWGRVRTRLGAPPMREVGLRDLGRYHLSGQVPGGLVAVSRHLVVAERDHADRLAALAKTLSDGLADCAALVDRQAGSGELRARLTILQKAAEVELRDASAAVAAAAEQAEGIGQGVVASAFDRVCGDVLTIGTQDLPHRQRRYSRVFEERNHGVEALARAVSEGRRGVLARRSLLALEIEILGLAGRIRGAVALQAEEVGARVRDAGLRPIAEVDQLVGEWLDRLRVSLDDAPTAPSVVAILRSESASIVRTIAEVSGVVGQLELELENETWVGRLGETVLRHAQQLTGTYTLASPRGGADQPIVLVEVAFREKVAAFVESRLLRELHELTTHLTGRVRTLADALSELERVLVFNVELAGSEIDLSDDGPLRPELVEMVRSMAVGAVGRSHQQLQRTNEGVSADLVSVAERVCAIVDAQLDEMRAGFLSGDPAMIGPSVGGRLGRRLVLRARDWSRWWPDTLQRATTAAQRALGPERLRVLRRTLGGRAPDPAALSPATFAAPEPPIELPVVYRRLFSDLPLEAGDLLAGRQDELHRLRGALAHGAPLRSAAVIGIDRQSAVALVRAATRGSARGVSWLDAGAPASPALVDTWLREAQTRRDLAIVVENVRWLFQRRPGGHEPLEHLTQSILASNGANPYVLLADAAVWRHASAVTGIGNAMGAVIELDPLTVDELERAVSSRHGMSGYELVFDAEDDLVWQVRHAWTRGEDVERRRKAWFHTLHSASAGVLQDALALFLASVVEVDDQRERVRVGPVRHPPVSGLAELPDDLLVILFETARQGWTTAEAHARLFRTPEHLARAELARLHHLGLLSRHPVHPELHLLAAHLRGPIHRVFVGRGWA